MCPVTDIGAAIAEFADAIGPVATGALEGTAATAGIDAATGRPITLGGEATGAALGGVGGELGSLAGGGAGATSSALGTADTAPISAGDIGAGGGTAGAAGGSFGAGAPVSDFGFSSSLAPDATTGIAGGADSTTAALSGAAGATGGVPSTGGTLDPITVTSSALPAASTSGGQSAFSNIMGPALAGAMAGGGGSGVPGTQGQPSQDKPQDFSSSLASNALSPGSVTDTGPGLDTGGFGTQFLTADPSLSSMQSLPSDFMQQLMGPADTSGASSGFDLANAAVSPADTGINPDTGAPDSGFSGSTGSGGVNSIEKWLSSPKNVGTAGLLGLSLKNALSQPKLPGASQTASAAATQGVKGAESVINSGGTATPEWSSQKSSIDATINQQIQQQTQAIQQAAANSGEGNQNSGIVQQQIAQMTANANTQRQQLYAQAQQQNVSNALSELSGGDATLTSIGNMQLKQSEQAQQLAAQTAEMALMLQTGGNTKMPGTGAPGP